MRDGMPHAPFIGFSGTPIERKDANTGAVFGDYIDSSDIMYRMEQEGGDEDLD